MIQLIPHFRIAPSPLNPRKRFDEASLQELAESIRQEGLLQNLVVRPNGDLYEIAAGERRWRALLELVSAGHIENGHEVPCRVVELTDLQLLQLATTENLARADMTPLEEARAFQRMLELGSDVATISAETGLSERTVKTRLALVELLSATAIERLEAGRLTLGQAQALTSGSHAAQDRLLEDRTSHTGAFDVTPAGIRRHLEWRAIPLSRARFDRTKYTGEITPANLFDEDAEPTFADVDQFHQLQAEHVEELKAEAERQGKWAQVGEYFPRHQFDSVEEDAADPEKAGVFIVLRSDGEVEIHEGLVKIERESYRGEPAKPQEKDPMALTGTHRERINAERERAVQASLADNRVPTFAILAFSLLQTHYPDFLTVGYRGATTGRDPLMETLHPAAKKHLEHLQLGPITRRALETHPRNDPNDFSLLKELMGTSMADLTGLLTLLIPLAINAGQRWNAGQLDVHFADLWRLLEEQGHDQPTERLLTWRELGAEWLLLYPKARLEQIYQEATGEEPGASLTRKNLAAGILDHARPGWLDQVPDELLLPDAQAADDDDMEEGGDEEECSVCGQHDVLVDDMCSACYAEWEDADEEGEGELA